MFWSLSPDGTENPLKIPKLIFTQFFASESLCFKFTFLSFNQSVPF